MNFRIVGAILKKDVLSLSSLVALIALLFLADPIIVRLDLLPAWSMYNVPVILIALVVLILPVFHLDSAAGLTDDWLCRPVPARELVAAKLLLVFSATYLPRAIGAFVADLSLGFPLAEAFLDAVLRRDKPSLFLLPIFLFTAIVTRSFVQGFEQLGSDDGLNTNAEHNAHAATPAQLRKRFMFLLQHAPRGAATR